VSNERGQGAPPKSPQGPHATSSPAAGRPLRGPQASANPQARSAPDARGSIPGRSDELAHLYRKIADLQADVTAAEARAVKAEHEQEGADSMLGQMLARVSEVEARLRTEQKRAAEGEAALAQSAKLRASQGDMLERLQAVESQSERLRVDLTHARREAATHRLAADDQLHLLAKEREETASLRARLDREEKERESLWARLADLDRAASERNDTSARLREQLAEVEANRQAAAARERDLTAKLEQAWVEIRHAHDSADALEDQLTEARDRASAEHAAAEDARRELAAERAQATETEADVARLDLAKEAGERALIEARAAAVRIDVAREAGERALASARADVARLELAREAGDRALTEARADVARLELAREAGDRALTEARAEVFKARATHERALAALRESHTVELADALSERSRRERSAVDSEIAAGRRDLLQLEETLADARRQIEIERAANVEAQSLLAGEREWVAEMEEDSLRREEDLEKTRRAQSRADAHARAAEARRTELEDAFAEMERALAANRGDLEALRVEAAMARMRIAELERERELRAGFIEVNAVPAEIERLRRRVASAEARAAQMHTELADSIDEVTHLLTELERREVETARIRTASLASARSVLEHVTAATRPAARPGAEGSTSASTPPEPVVPPSTIEAMLPEVAVALAHAEDADEPTTELVNTDNVVNDVNIVAAATTEATSTPSGRPPPLPPIVEASAPVVVPPPLPPVASAAPSVGPPPLPAAAAAITLPLLHDDDDDQATVVVERDSVRPPPQPLTT
jgi:hypothetical protein